MDFESFFPKTPLHDAVAEGDLDAVRDMLDQGADVDALDEIKRTPLYVACSRDKSFLKVKQSLQAITERIHAASFKNSESSDLQKTLDRLSQFAPMKLMGLQYRRQDPVEEPPEDDDTSIARLLLERGGRTDGLNSEIGTPLSAAAGAGRRNTVELLLDHGADIDAPDSSGETALFHACQTRKAAVVRLLLERGADAGSVSRTGSTALHAAARGRSIEVARTLLSAGMDVNAATEAGTTPLCVAAMYSQEKMAAFLRDRRAVVGLLEALAMGDLDAARSLPSPPVSIRSPTWGYAVLRWAINTTNREAVELLVERGVRASPTDPTGYRILRNAIMAGDETSLRMLLPADASLAPSTYRHRGRATPSPSPSIARAGRDRPYSAWLSTATISISHAC